MNFDTLAQSFTSQTVQQQRT